MVDVAVGSLALPDLGIEAEVGRHVLVHKLLQINPKFPVGANDDIGTHADVWWYITQRVGDATIATVIRNPGVRPVDGRLGLAAGVCSVDHCFGLSLANWPIAVTS